MSYYDLLKDPRWQKKRLEIFNRDNWACQICGEKKATLHVHHKIYLKNKNPWEYPDELLATLCEHCHQEEAEIMDYALSKINEKLKSVFFSYDVFNIMNGLDSLQLSVTPHEAAVTLKCILENKELFGAICDSIFRRSKI